MVKESEMGNYLSEKNERYHGLDLLRGFAMMLGLLMHANLAYKTPEIAEGMGIPAIKLEEIPVWIDLTESWIQLWRMPLFFVLAVFFGCMILQRRGALGFLQDFVLSNLIADGSEQVDFNTSLKYITSFEDVRRARKLPKPRILKSHSQYDERFCNVVYILRDPREVYISFYNYLKGHLPNQTTLSQFIRSDFMFPGKWHEHTSSWANKHNVRITVRYEEMLSDPIQVVNNIVESVPTLNYSRQQIEKAVELSNFGRMKDLEDKFGRPFSSEEERKKAAPFMRSGASDTWRQVLSERDLQYIESISREEMIRLNYEVTS